MRAGRIALVIVVLAVALAATLWYRYLRTGPSPAFATVAEEFKYGSIGAEVNGVPFDIWKALPLLCRERLPGGYASLGFITEPGHALPIGVSVRQFGVPRVGFNCAACHTARVDGVADPILGAPASQLDLETYTQFVLDCIRSPAFTPTQVLAAVDAAGGRLDLLDRIVYRFAVVPRTRDGVLARADADAWMRTRPPHGPGRTDALNPWREKFDMHPERDALVATVDFPAIWNQRIRTGMWLHWDGDNNSLAERNLSAALAGGATEASLDHPSIDRVTAWLETLPPPAYPFAVDRAAAEAGRRVYAREGCGRCHDVGGAATGQTTPLRTIGTDAARVHALTPDLLANMLTVGTGYPWKFTHYRQSDGYANAPLDGIWARSPYLHNGSVPSLDDLLTTPDRRPREFRRGCTRFDPKKVGFSCADGATFDVSRPGNGNRGHEYGTSLGDDERAALVEYLKTL